MLRSLLSVMLQKVDARDVRDELREEVVGLPADTLDQAMVAWHAGGMKAARRLISDIRWRDFQRREARGGGP